MDRFHIIEDAAVILRSKGVFKQVQVFRRGDELYARHGSGFIKLFPRGGTTHSNVSWLDMELPQQSPWIEEGISALRIPAATLAVIAALPTEVAA